MNTARPVPVDKLVEPLSLGLRGHAHNALTDYHGNSENIFSPAPKCHDFLKVKNTGKCLLEIEFRETLERFGVDLLSIRFDTFYSECTSIRSCACYKVQFRNIFP